MGESTTSTNSSRSTMHIELGEEIKFFLPNVSSPKEKYVKGIPTEVTLSKSALILKVVATYEVETRNESLGVDFKEEIETDGMYFIKKDSILAFDCDRDYDIFKVTIGGQMALNIYFADKIDAMLFVKELRKWLGW